METTQQENIQEIAQENNGAAAADKTARVNQIVPPKEVWDEIEEMELQYRESLMRRANEPV